MSNCMPEGQKLGLLLYAEHLAMKEIRLFIKMMKASKHGVDFASQIEQCNSKEATALVLSAALRRRKGLNRRTSRKTPDER